MHPREVDEHFAHGTVTNYWGGSSSATTHLLDAMHYRGLLRVVRREAGIRIYAAHEHAPGVTGASRSGAPGSTRWSTCVVRTYAPLPAREPVVLVRRLRYARAAVGRRARPARCSAPRRRLAHARVDGVDWYWPADETMPRRRCADDAVRLLAPFDPVVWDRRRFELLWGWAYRFEAYTPAPKRKLGYYALPLLWRDRVIGWANLAGEGRRRCSRPRIRHRPPPARARLHAGARRRDRRDGRVPRRAASGRLTKCARLAPCTGRYTAAAPERWRR